jgi:hypothetical protein
MTKDEALERKAENARELGLDYEPVIAQDTPVSKWLAWYLSPSIDPRKEYGDALEFDAIDRYYQVMYEAKLKEKNT